MERGVSKLEELREIKELLLSARHLPQQEEAGLIGRRNFDMVMKALTGATTVGVVTLVGLVLSMQTNSAVEKVERKNLSEKVDTLNGKFDVFTSQPRFDQNHFNQQISTRDERINTNEKIISMGQEWRKDADSRLTLMEIKMENQTNVLKDIKGSLKEISRRGNNG